MPPLDRLLHTPILPPRKQAYLIALRQSTNPLQLRQRIHDLIDKIAVLPSANGTTEDIRLTLFSQEAAIPR